MSDLKFAFRQLLKNPGFTVHPSQRRLPDRVQFPQCRSAKPGHPRQHCYGGRAVEVLTRESGDRTPDGCQSTPKSNRQPAARPPLANSTSLVLTRPADHFASAPDANSGGLGFLEISGRPNVRQFECQAAVPGRVARKPVCHASSRMAFKLRVRSLGKRLRISAIFHFHLIQQGAQSRARARVPENPFPGGISVQLGEKSGQIRDELGTLRRRQTLDRHLDFLRRAHGDKLRCRRRLDKLAYRCLGSTPLPVCQAL